VHRDPEHVLIREKALKHHILRASAQQHVDIQDTRFFTDCMIPRQIESAVAVTAAAIHQSASFGGIAIGCETRIGIFADQVIRCAPAGKASQGSLRNAIIAFQGGILPQRPHIHEIHIPNLVSINWLVAKRSAIS